MLLAVTGLVTVVVVYQRVSSAQDEVTAKVEGRMSSVEKQLGDY